VLDVGTAIQLRVILRDGYGLELANRRISFSSSDERVLSVNEAGLVRALAEGDVVITATSESTSGRMTIVVTANQDPPEDPPASSPAWLWGMVIADSGVCIDGATVTVVRGQALGRSITQTTPCDAWAYDGGFSFTDLTPGVEMTIRATAPGYNAREMTLVPWSGGQHMAVLFELSRIP